MAVRKVIIAGGGVAGTATALALQQAGIEAEVYEAHPSGGADAGAFLTVMRNGMAALAGLGAAEAVNAVSFPARAVALLDAQGQELGRRPIEGPARSLTRAALYRALQDLAATRGIPVHHGKRVTAASSDRDGIEVGFSDGSRVTGDVLVGADGIHSRTRRLIDPDAPEPRYAGLHVVYGYTPGNPAGLDLDEYHMIRGSRAFFGVTVPGGDGRTWWFARIPGEKPAAGITAQQWRDLALRMFRDDATPAHALIAASGAEIVGGDSHDIPTTPHWHNARMVLAGDAAHAAVPAAAQGASMAIEDAVALAAALHDHNDPAAAFAAYEDRRRTETEETVAASARLSSP
ncbi:FAD-dependent monooxygenase [Actinoplanes utahensis]|uniref:FAD-dependent oxidoreductase n=1 Tax=Actinoplanes utahensis TaxID=1869 RepID=A0A0A6XCS8_ACTUT|nr:FAD-dependent monooxygenase [Actinoplanes utahensis]KHD77852.1 FAD-dependent oxidoreductase [Actinoplanes utahensis]GIF32468.1 FAD-dependent oxidoreductase [Actinoplanes utahensis]